MKIKGTEMLLIGVALAGISYGALQLHQPSTVSASAECCDTSATCEGTGICWEPVEGQAPCSPEEPNYCKGNGELP